MSLPFPRATEPSTATCGAFPAVIPETVNVIDADASAFGNQDFAWQGLDTTPDLTIGQGQVKYYHSGGNTFVVGNVTPDATADFQIEIAGVQTLTVGDFFGVF